MSATLTRSELATALGMHADSVKRHHHRATPPPHERRGGRCFYDLDAYSRWMIDEGLTGEPGGANGTGNAGAAGDPSDPTSIAFLRREKLRQQVHITRIDADLARRRCDTLRSTLLDGTQVKAEWSRLTREITTGTAVLPEQAVARAVAHGLPDRARGQLLAEVREMVASIIGRMTTTHVAGKR